MKIIGLLPPGTDEKSAGPLPDELEFVVVHDPAELTGPLLEDALALMTTTHTRLDRAVLERLQGVKLVQQVGVGVDSIDLVAARELGIPVCNVSRANVASVAEYVIMAAIYITRRIDESVREGRKGRNGLNPVPLLLKKGSYEIRGRTMGIVGYGAIGHEVAVRAMAMGMRVMSTSVRSPGGGRPTEAEVKLGVERVSFDQLLSNSDIVSIHVPLADETRDLIGKRELEKMKRGGYLINAARGGIVDEAALAEALHGGHLAGAAVDNFLVEPIELDNPLLDAPNVLMTPHVAGTTTDALQYMVQKSFENCLRVARGEEPRDRVC